MESAFLATKFFIPPKRSDTVARPRLYPLLDAGLRPGCRGVLLSTPAGFGKTTLLSEWIESIRLKNRVDCPDFAWLSLDRNDNDASRFFNNIITAWQRINPEVGQTAIDMIQLPLGGAFTLQSALVSFLNDLSGLAKMAVLVVDDYHLIENPLIHEEFNFLIEHLPPQVHLIITGRTDPPLTLAQWRARGQMVEVRHNDLRFSREETLIFLEKTVGIVLPEYQLKILDERMEGWAAGLQLAALSIRGRENTTEFIASFNGGNRYILDYLAEEVLQRQPDDLQQFLLQTAILERMNGALCDAVTGRTDGQNMLERLEQANLFIIPLDTERAWYRYHRLFADFLKKRRQSSRPEFEREELRLHQRASLWLETHGMESDAIEHALRAKDLERAVPLIEKAVRQTWLGGETGALLGWFDALPSEIIRTRPKLSLAYAWTLMSSGQLEDSAVRANDALVIAGEDDPETRSEAGAVLALSRMMTGDLTGVIESAVQARRDLPECAHFLRGIIAFDLGLAYDMLGNPAESVKYYQEAYTISRMSGNTLIGGLALVQLADLTALAGRLSEADGLYAKALQMMADSRKWLPQIAGMAYIGLGRLRYERNDLQSAEMYFQKCAGLGLADFQISGLIHQALTNAAMGDGKGALTFIRRVGEATANPILSMGTLRVAEALRIRVLLRLGNVAATVQWAEEYRRRMGDGIGYLQQTEGVSYVDVLLAQDNLEEAEQLIQSLLEEAEASGLTGNRLELLAQLAVTQERRGERNRALETLKEALGIGEPEGFIRLFLDAGSSILSLLRELKCTGYMTDYINEILRVEEAPSRPTPEATVKIGSSVGLMEPLSEREMEVLQLIAQGCSNQDIAQKLIVAVSTVKTHINNIYGKLGVRTRTQALARVGEIGTKLS